MRVIGSNCVDVFSCGWECNDAEGREATGGPTEAKEGQKEKVYPMLVSRTGVARLKCLDRIETDCLSICEKIKRN